MKIIPETKLRQKSYRQQIKTCLKTKFTQLLGKN